MGIVHQFSSKQLFCFFLVFLGDPRIIVSFQTPDLKYAIHSINMNHIKDQPLYSPANPTQETI